MSDEMPTSEFEANDNNGEIPPPPYEDAVAVQANIDLTQGSAQETEEEQGPASGQSGESQEEPADITAGLNFVARVRSVLGYGSVSYRKFLEATVSHQKEEIGRLEFLTKISEVFRDHGDLLQRFNEFLPNGQDIVQYGNEMILVQLGPGYESGRVLSRLDFSTPRQGSRQLEEERRLHEVEE